MPSKLEMIQQLADNHDLRSAKVLTHALTDSFIGSKVSTYKTRPSITSLSISKGAAIGLIAKVNGYPLSPSTLIEKTIDGVVLYDAKAEEGFRIRVRENSDGSSSILLSSNSKRPGDVSKTLKELLGELGLDSNESETLYKEACNAVGTEITKTLSKSEMEMNIASKIMGKDFPIGYKEALERAAKTDVSDSEFIVKTTVYHTSGNVASIQLASKPGSIPAPMLDGLKNAITAKGISCNVMGGSLIIGGLTNPVMVENLEKNINKVGVAMKALQNGTAVHPQTGVVSPYGAEYNPSGPMTSPPMNKHSGKPA